MTRTFTLVSSVYLFTLLSCINSKQYRTDYEYNEQTNAFYKLHIESMTYRSAQSTCEVEGAGLMLPATIHDIAQVHSMFKLYPDLGDYVWVKDDGEAHEEAEEPAVIKFEEEYPSTHWGNDQCEVLTREGLLETARCHETQPFVCKVDARDAPYNTECNVYGNGYQRSPKVNSCYKIPTISFTWNQAYAECSAEGGHLVVLNSQDEHDYVQTIMKANPVVLGSKAQWFFYAGFRAQPTNDGTPRVFKTIFNQTLEEAGYSTWAEGEPNNHMLNENCGTLFKNDGKLNDVDCNDSFAFICEKEIV